MVKLKIKKDKDMEFRIGLMVQNTKDFG